MARGNFQCSRMNLEIGSTPFKYLSIHAAALEANNKVSKKRLPRANVFRRVFSDLYA